jgi:hypothetical protein
MPLETKKKAKAGAKRIGSIAPKSAPRVVVTYVDRSWTDRLAAPLVDLRMEGTGVRLRIGLAARGKASGERDAVEEFATKGGRVDTVQVARKRFAARLQAQLRLTEGSELSLELVAGKRTFLYPATVVFGPDAITFHLG